MRNRAGTRPVATVARGLAAALAALAGLAVASAARASHGSIICETGGPYTIECTGGTVSVGLDASRSRDQVHGLPLRYTWTTDCPGGVIDRPHAVQPTLTLTPSPAATCHASCRIYLDLVASDGRDDDCNSLVEVVDTTPPEVTPGNDDLACLWPPNRREACFSAADFAPGIAADACGEPTRFRLAGCETDPPGGACRVAADGRSLCLLADRSPRERDGRRYRIAVVAADSCGNAGPAIHIGNILVPRHPLSAMSCRSASGPRSLSLP
jgi:hypothetical protein